MKKNNSYLFYKEYLRNRKIDNKSIFISKTNDSYLIGPLINENFDEFSFYKRIKSNCIYDKSIYKKIHNNKRISTLINAYGKKLNDNEVIEIFKDNSITIHKIIMVPRDNNEKK